MPVPQSEFWEAGVVNQTDVKRAESESQVAWSVVVDTENRLSAMSKREQEVSRLITRFDAVRQIRQLCDAWTTRVGAMAILLLASTLGNLVFCHLVRLPLVLWAIPTIGVLSLSGFFGFWLFKPDDESLSSSLESLGKELLSLRHRKLATDSELAKARAQFERLESIHQKILREFRSRINRLRSTNWQVLQGIPFEEFLAEVFREWGYEVETTKASGDQGVDLIVSKAGLRNAIQAKGYPSSTVGNGAVQEAHTGMRFYRCQRCAVITNSTFTASARKLAAAVECTLIDGTVIPSLIEGQITL